MWLDMSVLICSLLGARTQPFLESALNEASFMASSAIAAMAPRAAALAFMEAFLSLGFFVLRYFSVQRLRSCLSHYAALFPSQFTFNFTYNLESVVFTSYKTKWTFDGEVIIVMQR